MNTFLRTYHRATACLRPLPNFLVLGTQKAGTTSLFHYICQHPEVFVNKSKEIHFFDRYSQFKTAWYRSHFPLLGNFLPNHRIGEATPYYLCHPHAPRCIFELLPTVKLIVILRDPVERAISHYFHEVKKGREELPLFEALQKEDERCAAEWQKMVADMSYTSREHQSFSYKQRGVYIEQLRRYWKFFSEQQMLILESSRLFTNPHVVLQQVFQFLDINQNVTVKDVTVQNANSKKKAVAPEVYTYLKDFFSPYNALLSDALGRDFGW
ncbi:MAG: sulfotransferase [Candidatus Electrothrix sp. AU1_5]|nr:sulfotransferase [Candidatus Electrothrix gigas]